MTARLDNPKSRRNNGRVRESHAEADVSLWKEALFGAELLLLHTTPVYYGFGAPRGDESAVVVIPGFLGSDFYLMHLHAWLRRMHYQPFFSGIGVNADCPNLLIEYQLNETITKARKRTRGKVHLIGHSLGGIIARSIAAQRPNEVASVITLGAPFRGTVMHRTVMKAVEAIRKKILDERGPGVLPGCYTGQCTCDFIDSLKRPMPSSVLQTAIYTRDDGMVDWRYCRTGNPDVDFEVSGTHIGLAFNSTAYTIMANRLAEAQSAK